jgi:hypothetical protein
MIDGNLSMANSIVNETEQKNSYWADVRQMAVEMDEDIDRYPIPVCFDPFEEQRELYLRNVKINIIAERFIRMKYYRTTPLKGGE